MGKAFKAPSDKYRRSYHVTEHAVERFRERAPRDLKSRDNYDLSNLLDSAVCEAAEEAQNVEDILDDEVPARVVSIKHIIKVDVVALIKDAAIVTVLAPDQAAAKRASGRWTRPDRTPLGMGRLGDKFAKQIAAVPPTIPPKPLPPPKIVEPEAAVAPQEPAEELRAICYDTPGCAMPQSWWTCKKSEVAAQVAALIASGILPSTIRVWKPVALKTRVVVEVSEEE